MICADVVEDKVERLRRGEVPIVEDGLDELVREGLDGGRLSLRRSGRRRPRPTGSSSSSACRHPSGSDGSADMAYIEAGRQRDRAASSQPRPSWSTSRPCRWARPGSWSAALGRSDVSVVSNPEFLREGSAVHDCFHPDRIVIGSDDQAAAIRVAALYKAHPGAADRHRPRVGRDDQVRVQRLPRHQGQLRQRHGQPVRGRRRRRPRGGPGHGLRQAHRLRVPPAGPGLGRQLLPQGHQGPGAHRRGRRLRLRAAARASSP